MTSEQFAYWMQGFVELTPGMVTPSPEQWEAIKQHLQTVFNKVTPPFQRNEQSELLRTMDLRGNPHPGQLGYAQITC